MWLASLGKLDKPSQSLGFLFYRCTHHQPCLLKCREAGNLSVVIRDLPVDERPLGETAGYGPESLSNRELLAIILRVGTRRIPLWRWQTGRWPILAHCGNSEMPGEELQVVEGIGWPRRHRFSVGAGKKGASAVRAGGSAISPGCC